MNPALPLAHRRVIVAVALLKRQGENVADDVLARLLGIEPGAFAEIARSLERRRHIYRQRETWRATQAGVRAALDDGEREAT